MTCKTLTTTLIVGISVYGCTAFLGIPGASSAIAGEIPHVTFDDGSTRNFEAGQRYGFTHNTYAHTGDSDFDNSANGIIGARQTMESAKRQSDLIQEQRKSRDEETKRLNQDGGADQFTAFLLRHAIGGVKGLIDGSEPAPPAIEHQAETKAPDIAPPSDSTERFDQWQKDHDKISGSEPDK